MTAADVERLLAEKAIRTVPPDRETASTQVDVARRHIASAEKLVDDDPTLAFTALYDAMRKAIAAHMRSRGYRVTRGPGAHVKTGRYAAAALDQHDVGDHLEEFDTLRDLRNQAEYGAMEVAAEDVREALVHVSAIVSAIADDLQREP